MLRGVMKKSPWVPTRQSSCALALVDDQDSIAPLTRKYPSPSLQCSLPTSHLTIKGIPLPPTILPSPRPPQRCPTSPSQTRPSSSSPSSGPSLPRESALRCFEHCSRQLVSLPHPSPLKKPATPFNRFSSTPSRRLPSFGQNTKTCQPGAQAPKQRIETF